MTARIVARTETGFTVQVEVPFRDSTLDVGGATQRVVNEVGALATAEALGRSDTGGKPITIDGAKLTTKGRLPQGLPDSLRRGDGPPPRLPARPRRQGLLPARSQRPNRRQFDASLRRGGRR